MIVFITAIVYGLVNYRVSGYTDIFILLLAAYVADQVDFNNVLKVLFWEKLVIFLSLNIFSVLGVIEMTKFPINKYLSIVEAYAPGYVSPNVYGCQAGVLFLLYLSINRYKLTKLKVLLVWFLSVLVYIICRSRTELILVSVTTVLLLICNNPKNFNKVKRILSWGYPSILVLNFGLIYTFSILGYGNPIMSTVNDVLFNGRIGLALMNFNTYGISLFGSPIDVSIVAKTNIYYALDNGYTVLVLYYGLIGLLWYSYIQIQTAKKLEKINELVLMVVLFIINIWGIYEGNMVSLGGNFMVMAFLSKVTDNYSEELRS
ncbi:TPA: hypothetical protein ACGO4V_000189 [Streptococcus suis]